MTSAPSVNGIQFDSAAALQARPILAAHIAIINGIWAEIDLLLGQLLAVILGADAQLGITIYLALHSEGSQRDVIKAAASLKLNSNDAARVTLILDRIRNGASQRNSICHGLWGYGDEYPDLIFWSDKKQAIKLYGHIGIMFNSIDGAMNVFPEIVVYDHKKLKVVSDNLKRLHEELDGLYRHLGGLDALLPPKPQKPEAPPHGA